MNVAWINLTFILANLTKMAGKGLKNASQYELTGIDIKDAKKIIACPTKPYQRVEVGLQIQDLFSCHQWQPAC